MKIAHIFYSLSYGGIETLLVNTANSQVQNNYDVTIILLNKIYEEVLITSLHRKVKVINLKRVPKSKNPYIILKLNAHLLVNRYDVLHIHSAGIGNLILSCLPPLRILHVHSTTQITNSKIPKFDKCIAISKAVQNELALNYAIKNTSLIYNGVNFNKFIKRNSNSVTNKIISVGRLDVQTKNQDGLISEFNLIKNKVKANLYFVGDGPEKEDLSNLIIKLGLQKRVFLLGEKSQSWIQNNLCNYDVFIQASHSEGLGITAIEAAASCLPLILSNVDGHIEISEKGKLCELFDNNRKGDLGNKILDFYDDPKKHFRHANVSYDTHKYKYDMINYNDKIISLYKSNNLKF